MQIFYSSEFERRYKRLSLGVQKKAEEKEKIFVENPFDPRLKTHRLHGRFREYWAFSIDYRFRIIFRFFNDRQVRFYAVGDHSMYK